MAYRRAFFSGEQPSYVTCRKCRTFAGTRASGRSFDNPGPQSVTLTITRGAGGSVVLNYSAGTLLQSANAALPMNQWTAVPGANPPSFTVTPPTGTGMFYRVQAP